MSDDNKLWEGATRAREIQELCKRQVKLYQDMADTLALRAAYDLPTEGGVSFCIRDESRPMSSQVDSGGRGRGKYGHTNKNYSQMNSIKGVVEIKHNGELVVKDELLEFHRKTRGLFLRG